MAHTQDAGNRARPGPVQDDEAADVHAKQVGACPAQLPAPLAFVACYTDICKVMKPAEDDGLGAQPRDHACPGQLPMPQRLAMQSQGSDGNAAADRRREKAARHLQDDCGVQAEPQNAAEMQPLRPLRDAAPEHVQPEGQGLIPQQAGRQGGSRSLRNTGIDGFNEPAATAVHEGSRPSSLLPSAEAALHTVAASPLSAGREGAAPAERPAESPEPQLSPALADAAASLLLSVQVGSNSSSLQSSLLGHMEMCLVLGM